jgi:cytochrome c-type biogenesis protein CcmE
VDLTPRQAVPTAGRNKRKIGPVVVLAVVLVISGVLVFQFLRNATVYFCNADEVGVRQGCSGDQRFRLQGTVAAGSVKPDGDRLSFSVSYGGATVPVDFTGAPPELFAEGIPVVVEGTYDGSEFDGDNILVKHSEIYVEENPDRVTTSVVGA